MSLPGTSERVGSIQNRMSDIDGIDFDFIKETINNAPDDLRRFTEAVGDLMEDHFHEKPGFKEGFILSDQMNQIYIDQLKNIIEKLKKCNEFYSNFESWSVHRNRGNTQEIRTIDIDDCSLHEDAGHKLKLGGRLARIIKKEVKELERYLK